MTLTDKEYQVMRDAAIAVIREIGVETGGSNIQFAVNPKNGHMIVIEMNPRVSRSSALASKATGFPIAKIATKLAVGYTLDEIPNDITRETPACFEPTIDYVVTKVPRFAFEKFPGADADPGPADEVGGRGDGHRPHLQGVAGQGAALAGDRPLGLRPRPGRRPLEELKRADRRARAPIGCGSWPRRCALGLSLEEAFAADRHRPLVPHPARADGRRGRVGAPRRARPCWTTRAALARAKRLGMSDRRIMKLAGVKEEDVRQARHRHGLRPVYKRVDTCAAEFEARTPYLYSHLRGAAPSTSRCPRTRRAVTAKKKIIILGGGPNRIGQGIEFDYCCVHAVMALREEGYETIMVNCNPETVSTDYDTSDRLYFEPLTREDVLEIIDAREARGRDRPVRRADPAAAGGAAAEGGRASCWAPAPTPSTGPRTASASASW